MEYKKVKYKHIGGDEWQIIWPSGMKAIIHATDDDDVKRKIDHAFQLLG